MKKWESSEFKKIVLESKNAALMTVKLIALTGVLIFCDDIIGACRDYKRDYLKKSFWEGYPKKWFNDWIEGELED